MGICCSSNLNRKIGSGVGAYTEPYVRVRGLKRIGAVPLDTEKALNAKNKLPLGLWKKGNQTPRLLEIIVQPRNYTTFALYLAGTVISRNSMSPEHSTSIVNDLWGLEATITWTKLLSFPNLIILVR